MPQLEIVKDSFVIDAALLEPLLRVETVPREIEQYMINNWGRDAGRILSSNRRTEQINLPAARGDLSVELFPIPDPNLGTEVLSLRLEALQRQGVYLPTAAMRDYFMQKQLFPQFWRLFTLVFGGIRFIADAGVIDRFGIFSAARFHTNSDAEDTVIESPQWVRTYTFDIQSTGPRCRALGIRRAN